MSDIRQAEIPSPAAPPRTLLTPAAGPLKRRLRIVAATGATLGAGIVALVEFPSAPAPAMTPTPVAPVSQWVEVRQPLAFFALPDTEFGREPAAYEAQRNRLGGGRVDTLTFGGFGQDRKPYLRLSLYRIGAEPAPAAAFFVDMARSAAQAKLAVTRAAAPDILATRFGDFQVADIILASGAREESCVGFRHSADSARLRISGFACGTPTRPVDRAILACALDRLDLIAAAGEPGLSAFFARAEAGRGAACPSARLAASPVRESWLDAAGRLPPLRAALKQPKPSPPAHRPLRHHRKAKR
jgi:hypothetical protein